MINLNYLKERVRYDPETGLWTWLTHKHGNKIGTIAGSNNKGYVYISIDYKMWLSHLLAFLYMTGGWPKLEVDHINGIKNDNRWSNLREATAKQNMHNRSATKRSGTGVKGVSYHKDRGVYQVHISLGCYTSLEEARQVYKEAAMKLHGEFYRE